MPTGGFAWGTTWKFNTQIDDYSFETMNNIGEDRLVRATMPLRTQATLLLENELRASTVQKSFSVKKVLFKSEYSSDEFPGETQHAPPGGYTSIRTESDLMSDLENTIKNRD